MYIGVDLGTSSVKLIVTTVEGQILRTVSRNYELIIPKPSWSEQNPNDWYTETIDGLKELVVGYESDIRAISFSGQMHGLVLLDKQDKVLRNALLWNDQRTQSEVDYLNEEIGIDRLLQYTGNIALTGLTAPKVLWVQKNEPDIFAQISKVMLPKDYLVYKLSGVFASDVSDLSGTLYFNPNKRSYSMEMLEILGLSLDMLPSVHESYEVVGQLTPDLKELLHLTQDVQIVVGGGDQAVGAVGVGTVLDGECSISLGTSGVIFVSSDTFNIDTKSYLQSYAHANGKYHVMAVMLNAAGAIKWWNEQVLEDNDYVAYYKRVSEAPIQDDLFFLPYLTGERAPINDSDAKGILFGLGLHHSKKHIDRAIVEGVTFALRDSFELIKNLGVNIERVRITGGGAKSDIWAQMIADIMNVEVVKIQAEEGPALGAAILAMVGARAYSSVEKASSTIVKLSKLFAPQQDNVNVYREKYKQFVKIYPHVADLYKQVNEHK